MAQQQSRSQAALQKVDPVWAKIRAEAEDVVRREPEIGTFIYSSILHHDTLEAAVVHRVSERLDHADVSAELIRQAYADALEDQPQLGEVFRADIVAVFDRDPATDRFIEPVLYYKGFHAIQTHRLAHWLWNKGRKDFAYYLQSRVVRRVPVRHPSGGQDRPRHLPRSRHRPCGRRDRDDRRRCVDAARRDARRHRQGPRRPPSEDPRRRADRGGRQHHRQYRGRALRAHRGGIGGAQGGAEQRHRRGRAGEGRRRFPVPGAVAHHGSHVPWIIVGPFGIPGARGCRNAERVQWTFRKSKSSTPI